MRIPPAELKVLNCSQKQQLLLRKCPDDQIGSNFNYRPRRSWGKVIFSQAFVILSTGGGGGAWPGGVCMAGGMHGRGGGGRSTREQFQSCTRMHSSRMRTICCSGRRGGRVHVSQHALGWGVSAPVHAEIHTLPNM